MSVSRRTRLSVLAAAASGVLVVTMTGTALAAEPVDSPNCSDLDLQEAQAALDAVAPTERIRLENLCELTPIVRSDDTEEADDGAPATTPAAAPEEDNADTAGDDDSADEDDADDEKSDKKDSADDGDNDSGDNDSGDNDSGDNDSGDDENSSDDADGDRDCADFDSQADAQAAFEESSDDKERLDADDDGIACEDRFDTEDQQVAVYPKGGVATGGAAQS